MGDLCVAKMIPPPNSRYLGGPGGGPPSSDRAVFCEASRSLKWTINNTGIHAPVYKLLLPNPDMPGNDQPLFQISKPNPNAMWWSMFYFTYGGHLIPPKRIEFGRIQKNAVEGNGGGSGTRVTILGRTPEEKAVWQTLGEGNEDMVEWIVLCAALNLIDEEIIKAASVQRTRVPASEPAYQPTGQNTEQARQQPMQKSTGPTNSNPSMRATPNTNTRNPQPSGASKIPPKKKGFLGLKRS
ncbi:hypothetical protein MYAM1_003747 [Malassezia yamatoensis]|uniref:Uncharacterized protein n=1 Tax=Malassezia yamatoensis TaxID=253288 RepID=A0AAJ5YYG7_9BASI|nr:hypothetical protein MYAM1_003747 [Malassezia yamatoensis]